MGKIQSIESFDSNNSSVFEQYLSLKDKAKTVNLPSEVYKFPENTPLIGKFLKSDKVVLPEKNDEGKKTFNVFIFEHVQVKDKLYSLAGACLERLEKDGVLIVGHTYIIESPISKEFNGKRFKDFPVYDITEEIK